jgi:hypothetical protein
MLVFILRILLPHLAVGFKGNHSSHLCIQVKSWRSAQTAMTNDNGNEPEPPPLVGEVTIDRVGSPEPLGPTPTVPVRPVDEPASLIVPAQTEIAQPGPSLDFSWMSNAPWGSPALAEASLTRGRTPSAPLDVGHKAGPLDQAFEARTVRELPPTHAAFSTLQASAFPDTAVMAVAEVWRYDPAACPAPYGTPPGLGMVALPVPPRRHTGLWIVLIALVIIGGVAVGVLFGRQHRSQRHQTVVELSKPKVFLSAPVEQIKSTPPFSNQELHGMLEDAPTVKIPSPPPLLVQANGPVLRRVKKAVAVTAQPIESEADRLMREAEALLEAGKIPEARKAASKSISLGGTLSLAFKDRFALLQRTAREQPPVDVPVVADTAAMLADADRMYSELNWSSAIAQYQKVIESKKDLRQAYLGLARASWQSGDVNGTLDAATQALHFGGGVPARKLLGAAYSKQRKYDEALKQYERVLKDRPDDPDAPTLIDETLMKMDLPPRQPTP